MLLKTSHNSDRDWQDLANKYEVPLTFLLQQAAYLYDRQVSQVRAQLRRVGASKSSMASPVPGVDGGGEPMTRTTSGQQQVLGRALQGRDAASQEAEDDAKKSAAGRIVAPPISRNTSATAAAQLQSRIMPRASPKPAKDELHRRSMSPSSNKKPSPALSSRPTVALPSSIDSSDGEESSSDSNLPMQSRLLRRPPRRFLSSDEEEGDASPTFLPFNDQSRAAPRKQASAATLRDSPRQDSRLKNSEEQINRSQTSDSSASSTAQQHPLSHRDQGSGTNAGVGMAPVPRRTAELAGRRPQSTGNEEMAGRESKRAPSMGSSFSDLDGTYLYDQSQLIIILINSRCFGNSECPGGGIAQQYAAWWDGEQNEYAWTGFQKQVPVRAGHEA